MTNNGPAAARTTPVREPRFMVRRLQRIEIPIEPGDHDYRIRFHGQKSFIRASRLQAEQVVASQLGEVRVDVVQEKTELRG
jgi:hypothetical protein